VAFAAYAIRTKTATKVHPGVSDPLVFFDARMRDESIDKPLPHPTAGEAERWLRATIADPKQQASKTRGARARLAVVLGASGREAQAASALNTSEDDLTFSRVIHCAYGSDRETCTKAPLCDGPTSASMTAYAGAWAAATACLAAARQAGDTAMATRLLAVQSESRARRAIGGFREVGFFVAGLLAAWALYRRRRGRTPPPLLPAPWSSGDLYAALVRCCLWPFVLAIVIASVLSIAHAPIDLTLGISMYVLGLWWVSRLVFRRWGLSWRDSLSWRREGNVSPKEMALTVVAAIGFERAGRLVIGLASYALGGHLAWSDMMPPLDPASRLRVLVSLIAIAVLPALVEELVFRRVLFVTLRRRYAPAMAALASAALFALIHGYSPVGLLTVFWTGLVATWAFHRTGNLWPSVFTHGVGNAVVVLVNIV
jgi:membrane protease YdiL (CAAX protease family)